VKIAIIKKNLFLSGVWLLNIRKMSLAVLVCVALSGCGGMLPKGRTVTESPWGSFDEAKAAFDKITPYNTSIQDLKNLGFDPYSTPNIKILTYLDLTDRFMPNPSIRMEDLDPGVQECLKQRENCHGYEVDPGVVNSKRYGSFWADFFQFKRSTRQTGWRFNALIVILNGNVVYKLWGGEPVINRDDIRKKPLGPLQQSEDILRTTVMP
jgi:hypothetical protein